MSKTPLPLQLWITPTDEGYRVAPLFVETPTVVHPRLHTALSQFAQRLQTDWRDVAPNREQLDTLLWYAFAPALTVSDEPIAITVGQRHYRGRLPMVRFTLRDQRYVLLPTLEHHCFVEVRSDKTTFAQQLEETVRQELRARHRADPQEQFTGLFPSQRAFIHPLEVSLALERPNFPFEMPDMPEWLKQMLGLSRQRGTELERVGEPVRPDGLTRAYGRESEVATLTALLFGKQPTAVCLVGPLGCGRTTVVEEVFYRYCQRDHETDSEAPAAALYRLDVNRVISGMSVVGQWQERFEEIMEAVANPRVASAKRPRLWIDNPVGLLHVGKSTGSDLTLKDVLKTYLEAGNVTVLLEATPSEWQCIQATDRRFADLFQVVRLDEPPFAEAVAMVVQRQAELEQRHGCRFEPAVITTLFRQPRDRSQALPGAVMTPLVRLATHHREETIGLPQLYAAQMRDSGLRPEFIDPAQKLDGAALEATLSARLVAQPAAVATLLAVVHRLKAGVQSPDKPLATLLFIGPTGVGKTQAAKELAQLLFGDTTPLLRFDMNEYVGPNDAARLIGDAHHPDGLLTAPVRHRPFAVVLLDEIEKAAPAIHDLLLQLLGEGRLTDALGRTTDFSRTIILMTSNLGATEARHPLGFVAADGASQAAGYRAAVERFFRPEFVNRIDAIVPFQSLPAGEAVRIARLQLDALLQREGLLRRMTLLSVSDDALTAVVARGFEGQLGGRSLRRALERDIVAPVAAQLVTLAPTQPIVLRIDWHDGGLHTHTTALTDCPAKHAGPIAPSQPLALPELRARLQAVRGRIDALRTPRIADPTQYALVHLQDQVNDLWDAVDRLDYAAEAQPDRAAMATDKLRPQLRWRGFNDRRLQWDRTTDELRAYLQELYSQAQDLVAHERTLGLHWRIDTDFIAYRVAAIATEERESVVLHVNSVIPRLGDNEVAWLRTQLGAVLALAVDAEPIDGGYQGYGLRALLQWECGLHLFHRNDGQIIPVEVGLDAAAVGTSTTILRRYLMDGGGRELITDLRHRFIHHGPFTPPDWRFLWWLHLEPRP